MRLRRPLPAVQGDTLHIVGVGDNRIGKDQTRADEVIADAAVTRIRGDLAAGRNHLLMARCPISAERKASSPSIRLLRKI